MVRNYIRKTNRSKWDENSMKNAVLPVSYKKLRIENKKSC